MGEEHKLTEADVELDTAKREKLNAFRELAKGMGPDSQVHRVYAIFNSLEEFKEKAAISVANLRRYLDEEARPTAQQPDEPDETKPDIIPARPAFYAKPPESEIEIFVSFKHLDDDGEETRDCAIARNLVRFLRGQGFSVFFSLDSLERAGTSAYKKAIDNALERSTILIAVGTTRENLTSSWVEYEWDSFLQDFIEGFKPRGEIFTVIENMSPSDLPRGLRQRQVFKNSDKELARMANFIRSKLTSGHS